MNHRRLTHAPYLWLLTALSIGCADDEAFGIEFVSVHDGQRVGCDVPLESVGPDGAYTVRIADLRFYVSDLEFLDDAGEVLPHTFDEGPFQRPDRWGDVALVDLTGTESGTCMQDGITFAEGTPEVDGIVTGTTAIDQVRSVRFSVGVPQAVMQEVIANYSLEGAPAPLNQMYWSWASGYRHFVWNFAVDGPEGSGEGYIHVGSRDCAAPGANALQGQDRCGFVNTPRVELDFDPAMDTVEVDLTTLLEGIDFRAPVYDASTFEVIGEQTGVECHSAPLQPHCGPVFDALGIDSQGDASVSSNRVFRVP
ncbi:MAG: MbnP family copper-binding protein [Myxococcota bacterium]